MVKNIDTLKEDIEKVLLQGVSKDDLVSEWDFQDFYGIYWKQLVQERQEGSLRASSIGVPCLKKLWYRVNTPEEGEALSAQSLNKFMFGDLTEEHLLFLIRLAGHDVQGEQLGVEYQGVEGHIDGIIDGCLVDVKSAADFSFRKAINQGLLEDDKFGYLWQLGFYLKSLQNNPLLKEKSKAYFLWQNKNNSQIELDCYDFTGILEEIEEYVVLRKEAVSKSTPPERGFKDQEYGKSGNRALCTECSYCEFKHTCWPGLRTFLYSKGPVYLTEVTREPDTKEII